MESDANVLQYMIHHVFLPPQLPQESESDGSLMDYRLLLQVEEASRCFMELIHASDEATGVGTTAKWERVRKMLHNMSTLHEDKQDLVSAFKGMDTGGK
jgi:hypothetical protein